MKINEVETGSVKQRLDEVFPLLLLVPAVKAAAAALGTKAVAATAAIKGAGAVAGTKAAVAGAGKAALSKGAVSTGVKGLAKKGAANIASMGKGAGTQTAKQTLGRQMTSGGKIMKGVKKVGQKVGNTPHDTVDRVGDIADFISNPTGAPVPAPGAKQQPGAVAGVAQPPPQTQPTQGVSPEAGAAIANVQQAQVGGRAGIPQRKRQAVKAKA